jgi:uncharacterized protein (UPF0276 family)
VTVTVVVAVEAVAAEADVAAAAEIRQPLIGIGYRRQLARWVGENPPEVKCLEVIAEHFFEGGIEHLRELSEDYPLFVHGLGLSLGTPGSLDHDTFEHFARVVEAANPEWVSEHIAFTRTRDVDLGHLNPVRTDQETIQIIADHAHEVVARCGRPLLLENITADLLLDGPLSEPDFLNRLCDAANCDLLLDVTNLYINAKNHGYDPRNWIRELDPQRIVQLHVVGYSYSNGRWRDFHAEPIQDDLWELIQEVLAYAPVQSVILERDGNFPQASELAAELLRLERGFARH